MRILVVLLGITYVYSQVPTATFSYSYVGADSCANDGTPPTVQFNFDSYSNVDSFCVDFGDASSQCFTSADVGNPFTHTYSFQSPKTVKITLYNTTTMDSSIEFILVPIYAAINSFTIMGPDTICVGESYPARSFGFNNFSIQSWTWQFSNGYSVGNVSSASTTYSSPSSPEDSVLLVITGVCNNYTAVKKFVVSNTPPFENINLYGNDTICPGKKYTLSMNVMHFNRTANYSVVIDWGDGNVDSSSYASFADHIYNNPGDYTITVTLKTPCNDVVKTKNVHVGNSTLQMNTFNPTIMLTNDTICVADIANINVSGIENISEISWGDGDTSYIGSYLISLSHKYSAPGTYQIIGYFEDFCGNVKRDTVEVTVTNSPGYATLPIVNLSSYNGCPGTNFKFYFSANPSYTYILIFDDGNDTTLSNLSFASITHQYNTAGTYNPKVIVISACGDTDTVNITPAITVSPTSSAGVAFLSALYSQVCVNSPAEFSLSGNLITNQNYTSIQWDMGDGTTYNDSVSVAHTYSAPGYYLVTAKITTICGKDEYYTTYIDVKNNINHTMNWYFSGSSCVGQDIYMSPSIFPLASNDTIIFDYGDGNVDTVIGTSFAVHKYLSAGNYDITITLKPACGLPLSQTKSILIKESPAAEIITSTNVFCVGKTVSFAANPLNNVSTNYSWSISQGSYIVQDTGQTVSYTFTTPGSYYIELYWYSSCGYVTLDNYSIVVKNPATPTASFTATVSNDTVYLSNSSTNGDYYFWDFGDGNTQWGNVPYHVYNIDGSFTITLTVYNCDSLSGASATATQTVNITTKIITNPLQELSIYPNPATSKVNVSLPNTEFNVSVRSVIGEELIRFENVVNKTSIPVKNLPAGIYFIEINTPNGRAVRKLIKK